MADVQVTSAELKDGTLTVTGSGFTKTTTKVYVRGVEVSFETGDDFDGTQITVREGLPPQDHPPYEVYAVKGEVESAHVEVQRNDAPASPTPATEPPIDAPMTAPDAPSGDPALQQQGIGAVPPGPDLTASEVAPQPEPDHTASQTEQANNAEPATPDDDSKQNPYDPSGDAHEPGYKTAEPNVTPGDLTKDDIDKAGTDVTAEQMNQAGVTGAAEKMRQANEPDRTPLKADEHLPGADFRTRVENTKAEDLGKVIGPRDPYPKDNPPDTRESFHRIHGFYPPDEGGGEQANQMDANPKT